MKRSDRKSRVWVAALGAALAAAGCSEPPGARDLAITQTGPEFIRPGSEVIYEVTIANQGTTKAFEVVVDAKTPAGMRFLFNKGGCATSYPCAIGPLRPRQVKKISTHYSIPVTYPGLADVVHEVKISGSFPSPEGEEIKDGIPRNNVSAVKSPIQLEPPETGRKKRRR